MVRHGTTEMLRPRERRAPRMPNATPMLVEGRVLAYALAHPGHGPNRISAELAREKWGGIRISPNGAWRVLRRHGLNTRAARLALVAGYAAPPEPEAPEPAPERHLQVERPGQLVQMDCFCVGRLAGTKGTVWQYTAIDVASAYTWAELHASIRNPLAQWTSALARRVAQTWRRGAGRSRPCSRTTPASSARPTSCPPSPDSVPSTARSGRDGPRPTAVSSGCS